MERPSANTLGGPGASFRRQSIRSQARVGGHARGSACANGPAACASRAVSRTSESSPEAGPESKRTRSICRAGRAAAAGETGISQIPGVGVLPSPWGPPVASWSLELRWRRRDGRRPEAATVRETREPEGPPEVSGWEGRGAGVAPVPAAPWGPRPVWFVPQR